MLGRCLECQWVQIWQSKLESISLILGELGVECKTTFLGMISHPYRD